MDILMRMAEIRGRKKCLNWFDSPKKVSVEGFYLFVTLQVRLVTSAPRMLRILILSKRGGGKT